MAFVKIFFACGALDGDCSSPAEGLGARIFAALFLRFMVHTPLLAGRFAHALQITSPPPRQLTALQWLAGWLF